MAAIAKENTTAGPATFLATIPATNLNSIIHIIQNILNYLKIVEYIKRKKCFDKEFYSAFHLDLQSQECHKLSNYRRNF
jgi:hypothetical protein